MEKEHNYLSTAFIFIALILTIWVGTFQFMKFNSITDLSGAFTSVGALFSGLAFALLIVTAMMQRSELRLQRDELKLQREEMALTREEFKTQNKTLSRQRFENTFFQLLDAQREITSLISVVDENQIKQTGLNSFVFAVAQVKGILYERQRQSTKSAGIYKAELDEHIVENFRYNWQDVAEEFRKSLESHENEFGQYLQHITVLLDFVENAEPEIDRDRYIGFLRAQLSLYEQLWLFYMGLTSYGLERNLKSLLEQSRLLVWIRRKSLITEDHYLQYNTTIGVLKRFGESVREARKAK